MTVLEPDQATSVFRHELAVKRACQLQCKVISRSGAAMGQHPNIESANGRLSTGMPLHDVRQNFTLSSSLGVPSQTSERFGRLVLLVALNGSERTDV